MITPRVAGAHRVLRAPRGHASGTMLDMLPCDDAACCTDAMRDRHGIQTYRAGRGPRDWGARGWDEGLDQPVAGTSGSMRGVR